MLVEYLASFENVPKKSVSSIFRLHGSWYSFGERSLIHANKPVTILSVSPVRLCLVFYSEVHWQKFLV